MGEGSASQLIDALLTGEVVTLALTPADRRRLVAWLGVPPSTEQKCTIVGLEAESRGFRGGSQYFCQRNP
jgi:hypothetical protein